MDRMIDLPNAGDGDGDSIRSLVARAQAAQTHAKQELMRLEERLRREDRLRAPNDGDGRGSSAAGRTDGAGGGVLENGPDGAPRSGGGRISPASRDTASAGRDPVDSLPDPCQSLGPTLMDNVQVRMSNNGSSSSTRTFTASDAERELMINSMRSTSFPARDGGWQSEVQRKIIAKILLKSSQGANAAISQERHELPLLAKCVEGLLNRSSPSMETHGNDSTLKQREMQAKLEIQYHQLQRQQNHHHLQQLQQLQQQQLQEELHQRHHPQQQQKQQPSGRLSPPRQSQWKAIRLNTATETQTNWMLKQREIAAQRAPATPPPGPPAATQPSYLQQRASQQQRGMALSRGVVDGRDDTPAHVAAWGIDLGGGVATEVPHAPNDRGRWLLSGCPPYRQHDVRFRIDGSVTAGELSGRGTKRTGLDGDATLSILPEKNQRQELTSGHETTFSKTEGSLRKNHLAFNSTKPSLPDSMRLGAMSAQLRHTNMLMYNELMELGVVQKSRLPWATSLGGGNGRGIGAGELLSSSSMERRAKGPSSMESAEANTLVPKVSKSLTSLEDDTSIPSSIEGGEQAPSPLLERKPNICSYKQWAKEEKIRLEMPFLQEAQTHRFPYRLFALLEYTAKNPEWKCAVSWSPDGRFFLICDREKLLTILPKFFRRRIQYRSFTRQLNMWGFSRRRPGETWRNKHFIREKGIECIRLLHFVRVKGGGMCKGDASRFAH